MDIGSDHQQRFRQDDRALRWKLLLLEVLLNRRDDRVCLILKEQNIPGSYQNGVQQVVVKGSFSVNQQPILESGNNELLDDQSIQTFHLNEINTSLDGWRNAQVIQSWL